MNEFKAFLSGASRQWLMGFAILWVIAFHFCMFGNLLHVGALNFLFGKGYLGVDIFLFLSAYGLCYSYEKRSLREFYAQRFRRLFPMYLVFVVALVTVFAALMPFSPWLSAVLQLTGFSNFMGMEVEWYIPSLILIYAFFPLIFRGVRWLYYRGIWWILALVALLVVTEPLLSKGIFYLFVMRLPLVVVAVAAYLAICEGSQQKLLSVLVFAALLGFCFCGRELLNGSQTGMLLMPLILFGLSQLRLRLPISGTMCFFGKHTLEIYLAQNLALNQFYANYDIDFGLKTVIAVGIIVVGSVVLWGVQEGWNIIMKRI